MISQIFDSFQIRQVLMAAKVDRRRCPNKRRLPSIGGDILKRYNLRKKRKVQENDDSSFRSGSTILEVSLGFGKYSVFFIYWK